MPRRYSIAATLAVLGTTSQLNAAGLVGQRTRSATAGDFDGEGLVDTVYGLPNTHLRARMAMKRSILVPLDALLEP